MRAGLAAMVLSSALVPLAAHAQPTANDAATAEVLFEDGRKLMSEGKIAAACAKLAESNRLDTGIGTLLYLAECYEKNGQTASAWATFKEAVAIAQAKGDPREKLARDRVTLLEPRLSKLTIVVGAARPPAGLVVRRDGTELGAAQWGLEVPIDPGRHTVTASAPGRDEWRGDAEIAAEGARVRIEVPPLRETPAQASAKTATFVPGSDGSTQRAIGLTVASVGVVGVVVGTIFGLKATSKSDEARAFCEGPACQPAGIPLREDARSAANVSTIALAVGGVALVAGGFIFLTAPRAPARVSVGGACDGVGCGATISGRF